MVNDHYQNILNNAVKENIEEFHYPILNALMYLQLYKVIRLVLIIFTSSYFLGILWHVFVCDLQVHREGEIEVEDDTTGEVTMELQYPTFCTEYLSDVDDTNFDILVKIWYFAITTLSTIGYGDFNPLSSDERAVAIFILLCGVTVFSFIMS